MQLAVSRNQTKDEKLQLEVPDNFLFSKHFEDYKNIQELVQKTTRKRESVLLTFDIRTKLSGHVRNLIEVFLSRNPSLVASVLFWRASKYPLENSSSDGILSSSSQKKLRSYLVTLKYDTITELISKIDSIRFIGKHLLETKKTIMQALADES